MATGPSLLLRGALCIDIEEFKFSEPISAAYCFLRSSRGGTTTLGAVVARLCQFLHNNTHMKENA